MTLPEWAWAGLGFVFVALWKGVGFFVSQTFSKTEGHSKELDEIKALIIHSQNKLLLEIGQMENYISKVQISLNNLETTTRKDFERMESDMNTAKVEIISVGRNITDIHKDLATLKEWKKNSEQK